MPRLLVSEIFPPHVGGSGRWLYEVYRRLPQGTVLVAAGENANAAAFDAESGVPTCRIVPQFRDWGVFGWHGFRNYVRLATRIRQLMKQAPVREVYVARCLPEGFAAWMLSFLRPVPYVVFVHGEETRISANSRQLGWMTRWVYRRARYFIANSENTSRVLQEEWSVPAHRIRVLYPGVDAQTFIPAPRDEAQRRALGWEGRRVVLTVGRLQMRKGHDMLLRALPKIQQAVPDVLYAIVGNGEERPRLEHLADELNVRPWVRFHGEIPDAEMLRAYQQCDLFVLPNREVGGDFEGFGMVLVEAQACGKPVIAGMSGGTKETMQTPHTGLLVPCETPEPLAENIIELLLDEPRRAAMGQAARQWVLERFDWGSLVKQAEAIFAGEKQTSHA